MVIDASALMAFLQQEAGFDKIRKVLEKGEAVLSCVNRTEVKGKLVGSGMFTTQQVDSQLDTLRNVLEIVNFNEQQSDLAAYFYARRNAYQLSLGDCACLALAEIRRLPVLTAEKAWASIPNLAVKVVLVR